MLPFSATTARLLLLATATACSKAKPPAVSLADLGREVGLEFPSGTRLVGVARERGIDDMIELKVEMRATDLAGFLARSPVPAEAFHPGEGGLLGPDHDWWDPGRAPHLRTGQAMRPNARALNIGIGDAQGGVAALYIVNHGT